MFEILLPLAPSLIYWLIRRRDAHTARRLFRRIRTICAYEEIQKLTHRVAVAVVMDDADRKEIIDLTAELIAYGRKRGVPWFIKYLDIHAMDDPDRLPDPINASHLRPSGSSSRKRRLGFFRREKKRDLELLETELARVISEHYTEHDERDQAADTVFPIEHNLIIHKESREDLLRQQKVELGARNGRVKPRKAA